MRSISGLVSDYNEYAGVSSGLKVERIKPAVVGVVFTMIQEYNSGPIAAQQAFINRVKSQAKLPVFKNYIKRNDTLFAGAPQYGVPVVLSHHNNQSHQSVVDGLEEVATEFATTVGI